MPRTPVPRNPAPKDAPGLPDAAAARIAAARPALRRWFAASARELPWRHPFGPGEDSGLRLEAAPRRAPYAAWVAEIMLQQTQVSTVAPRFADWLRAFPSVVALARAPEERVLRAWAGLGYYARARNLHRGAKALAGRGAWPATAAAWREIPGVGDYTAGALASIVFGARAPLLDGNAVRVFSRFLGLAYLPGDGAAHKRAYWEAARLWADAADAGVLNEALMELGALVCTPANPRCGECPLAAGCAARARGAQQTLPPARKRARVASVRAVAVVATAGGRVLLETRARGGFLAGHAMFPLFLGEDAARWRPAFRARHPDIVLGDGRNVGLFRHAIMDKRYEVEVWTMTIRKLPADALHEASRGLAARLTNALARKIWETAKKTGM